MAVGARLWTRDAFRDLREAIGKPIPSEPDDDWLAKKSECEKQVLRDEIGLIGSGALASLAAFHLIF